MPSKPIGIIPQLFVTILSQKTEKRYSIVTYGDNRFKELYLAHDLTPAYKYFVIQEWHASFSEFMIHDFFHPYLNIIVSFLIWHHLRIDIIF
mgnify:CR=1 FL=1